MNYFETMHTFHLPYLNPFFPKFENQIRLINFSDIFFIKNVRICIIYSSLFAFPMSIGMFMPQHVCNVRGHLAGVGSPFLPFWIPEIEFRWSDRAATAFT